MINAILKKRLRQRLVKEYEVLFTQDSLDSDELREAIAKLVREESVRERPHISEVEQDKITEDLLDEFVGFGPIEHLMRNPSITEIMVNGPRQVYVEKEGRKELTSIVFEDDEQLKYLVYKILVPTRRRVDELYPYTDISLPDGSRVNIIIPPLALNGPTITIRKFLKEIRTINDLIALGTMNKNMGDFLVAAIKARTNIVFTGATGAGKTTTLNVLSTYISNEERIVTIEDTAELKLSQEHVVRLEARQPNIEGKGEITIRDLFRNSLRMRPERIILGEIRGAEALDMLQAICSGHGGSLAVVHAQSPADLLYRIETMILTSGTPISLEAIHRQIGAAIDLVVQQEQLLDGSRKITHITQINGFKDNQAVMEDIFYYEFEGIDLQGKAHGRWKATGIVPAFYDELRKTGIDLSKNVFDKD